MIKKNPEEHNTHSTYNTQHTTRTQPSVAYPKRHSQDDISDIYLLPHHTRGVFVNIALQVGGSPPFTRLLHTANPACWLLLPSLQAKLQHRGRDLGHFIADWHLLEPRSSSHPSTQLQEPFGLTLIEAAAHGVPIVATTNGGPVDIIHTLHNGILVDPTDHR